MGPDQPANVVLIGYRGCGKSAVARLLARRWGWTAVDTDDLIEAAAGRSIANIFESEGEAGFRRRECEVIAKVTAGRQQVIAVGGGTVTVPDNVERLRACGKVIWLTAPAEVLWSRIQQDARSGTQRPNLTPKGGLEEVREVLAKREAIYHAAADFAVDAAGSDTESVADWIQTTLDEHSQRI